MGLLARLSARLLDVADHAHDRVTVVDVHTPAPLALRRDSEDQADLGTPTAIWRHLAEGRASRSVGALASFARATSLLSAEAITFTTELATALGIDLIVIADLPLPWNEDFTLAPITHDLACTIDDLRHAARTYPFARERRDPQGALRLMQAAIYFTIQLAIDADGRSFIRSGPVELRQLEQALIMATQSAPSSDISDVTVIPGGAA